MTTTELLDAICQHVAGQPAEALDWRALLRVRDAADALLNSEINKRQETPA